MEELDYKKVGCEIQVRRTRNGITQTEFAKFLGISQTHLSNVESGRVMLKLKDAAKNKAAFCVHVRRDSRPGGL